MNLYSTAMIERWRLQNCPRFCYKNNETKASYSSWPFFYLEASMNPIPIAAALLVKALLDWWLED